MGKKNKIENIVTGNKPIKKRWFYLIIILLLISNLVIGIFYFQSVNKMTDNFPLLNPARKLFNKEDMIINIQGLRDQLNEIGSDPNISIYFEFLNTGANIAVNKDQEFFPASLIKLPVVMATVKKIESGQWTWSNELVLMRSDKDEKFGDLYQEPIGTKFTIESLVEASLVKSDNTAYRILLRNLEPEELEDVNKHLGLDQLFSKEGKISAKRYSILMRSLYNSSYLSDYNSYKLLDIMSTSDFKDYLSSGLPEDIKFSHKIGISEDEMVVLDSGIVHLPKRSYLLTVMISGKNNEESMIRMKDISEKVYNFISSYSEKE